MVEATVSLTIRQLTALRSALELLAAPSEEQLDHLTAIGLPDGVDEIALEFDDVVGLLPSLVAQRAATPNAAAVIDRLDGMLNAMSGAAHAALWTPSALRTAQEWRAIGATARRALAALSS